MNENYRIDLVIVDFFFFFFGWWLYILAVFTYDHLILWSLQLKFERQSLCLTGLF